MPCCANAASHLVQAANVMRASQACIYGLLLRTYWHSHLPHPIHTTQSTVHSPTHLLLQQLCLPLGGDRLPPHVLIGSVRLGCPLLARGLAA